MEACPATVTLLIVVLSVTAASAQWPRSYSQPYNQRYHPSYYRSPYYGYRYPARQPVYQVRNTPSPSEKRHDTGQVLYSDVAVSSLSTTDATSVGSMVTTVSPATSTRSMDITVRPVITSPLTTTAESSETTTSTSTTAKPVTTISTTSSTTTTTTTFASPTEAEIKDTSPTSTASPDLTGTKMNASSATENVTESTVTPADKGVNQTSSTTPIFQPFTMRPVHFILQHQENEDKQLKVDTLTTSLKQANEHIQEDLRREKTDEMTHLSNVKFSISEPVKVCCDDDAEVQKSHHKHEKSDVLVDNTSRDKIPETEGIPETTEGSSTTEKPDLQKFFFSNLFGPGGFLGRPRPQYHSRPVPLPPPLQRPQKQADQQYQQDAQRKAVQQNLPVKAIETMPINLHQPTSTHPQNGQPQHYNRPHVIQPIPTRPSQTLPQRPPFAYNQPPKLPIRIPRPTIRAPSGQLLKQVAGPVLGPPPGATWIPSSDIPNRPAAIQPDSELKWVPANLPARQDNSETLLFVDEDQPAKQIQNDEIGTDAKQTSFSTVPTPVLESENKTILALAKDEEKHFLPETIISSKSESVTPPSSSEDKTSLKQLEIVEKGSGISQKQIENTASAPLSVSKSENISPVPKAVTALGTDDEIQEQPVVQLVEDALIPRNVGDTIDQPVADIRTGQSPRDPSDILITDPVENTKVQPVRIARLPFRPPFPPHNETQPVRVPVRSAQSFRQSVRKPPRQRPPPTGFFQFQRPPLSSAPATPARPLQLLSTLSVQASPPQTPVQPPPLRSPIQPSPPPRSPIQPQLPIRPGIAPPTPLSPQPKQPALQSDPRLSTQSTSRPLITRPSAQTQPLVTNIENKSDAPSQGVLPQFNPASGLQFTLIKPSEISDENNNNRDIPPRLNQEIGSTFAGEIKTSINRSTTVQSVLEDIVQISKPDPFRIISGPSLSNQSSSNSQPPEAELPLSVPEEQVFLPAITVVSSVNFNKQPPSIVSGQNLSEKKVESDVKTTAVNEETTKMTLPIMNIFDIVPITNSSVETIKMSEVTSLPFSISTAIPVLNTTTVIPEVITEVQASSTTEMSSTHTESNSKPEGGVVPNKHSNSNITNILAGGFQLTSSDDVTEMQKVENSSKKEVLSLAGPGPMKPIPLDSPQQSAVDEEKTLKPGSVPVQPIQIPEVDDLEDDLDAVVSYVALLHRAVPPLNRKPTIQPSKVNTEKEQELPKPTIPQLPVHIRPIPSGAFIPGIGLAKRPGAVPIRINNLSNLPPDAILVRRPGPPPPTLLARPGPPPTLLARPGPPTQQTRPGPPPPIQTNVRPLSNGQFRPGIIFTLDEAGKPHFSPLPPRPQHLPPQLAIPETQPQSQALPEREKISSGQKPDDTPLRQPAVDQPPSSVETQTFVRPTQSQEYLDSEVPEVNDNSQPSLTTLEITEPKSTSPQPSELFSPARPTSRPTIQRPEILPLPTNPIPLKPETPPPPVKPASESPKTKPVILIPTIQKTEIDPRPQSLEIRPPPQSAILQRPGSQLLQRPSPQRPEVLLPFQPTSQTSVAQPLRPFPQRPESQPPSPAAQTIESQLPQGPIQLRPESQPQRPETKLPQLILQRPPPQRPGDLPSIQRPPLKRPQTLQRPEVLPAGMLPPPRPFPGAHPRPETPQRTQPPTLRPQLLPRPPTGPFFRPGVPPESPLRRPVVSKPQFQPSRPTVPFSQGKPSLQEPLKPQSGTDDFKPLTPSPEIPPATENQQLQSNQFIRGDDQKLIDNILGSLPDFLKGSVKIDHTNLGAENAVSVSNSYGNVIYQKRGITYIDQVQ